MFIIECSVDQSKDHCVGIVRGRWCSRQLIDTENVQVRGSVGLGAMWSRGMSVIHVVSTEPIQQFVSWMSCGDPYTSRDTLRLEV